MSSKCLVFPPGRTDIKELLDHHQVEQDRHSTYNVILTRVRATIVTVEKQRVLHNLSVFATLGIQHAMSMHHIVLSSVACPALQ
jgi:hypothetical protein